jgi:hypothetical protein
MRFALISDVHFGPLAYFQGKLTHQAEALSAAFVDRMNAVDRPALAINLADVIEDESRDQDLEQYGRFVRILGGVHWAVLRTVDEPGRAVHLPDEQLDWLGQDIAAATFPPILLMHYPASEMRLDRNRWFERLPHRCLMAKRQ